MKITAEMFFRILRENSEVALDVIRMLSDKLSRTHAQVEDSCSGRRTSRSGISIGAERPCTSPDSIASRRSGEAQPQSTLAAIDNSDGHLTGGCLTGYR